MGNLNSSNKKGSAIIVYFMIGIVFFLLALAFMSPLEQVVTGENVMGANGLNCSNPNITNYYKGVCVSIDIIPPIFIAVLLGLGSMLIARILL